jgi:osmoprotectant transport system substrate-binding protein
MKPETTNGNPLLRAAAIAVVLLGALIFAACGNAGSGGGGQGSNDSGGGGSNGSGPTITVGSKNFTEQFVLGELYAQALEANGFNVEKKLNLGSEQIADRALQSGQIDLYPEYTGTSLVAILPFEGKQPKTADATYEEAKKLYSQRDPADTMLEPAQFNNTYGIFVRREVAEKMNLKTLADLAEASPDLVFASYSEFQDRQDGYPNLKKNYPAFDFKKIIIANDLGLRYRGITEGEADVGVGFQTDGQLASKDLMVMQDEKAIWPFYQPAPVVRADVLEKNPKMEEVLNKVSASLTAEEMRKLNGAVDLEGKEPEDVAHDFLQEKGLLNGQ